jgi:hypothetical protein
MMEKKMNPIRKKQEILLTTIVLLYMFGGS